MKTKPLSSRFLVVIIALLFFTAQAAHSQNQTDFSINSSPLPAPTGFVNDFADVIDSATKQSLESKITEFKKTSNPPVELAVVTVKTTGDRPIFEYSLAVSRGWGIGSKANDNPSALLLVAIDDRKYFTQVSRDLEDELPDGLVGSLQRQFLVPEFKKANYSKGISDTIDAYISSINARRNGETIAPEASQTPNNRDAVDRAIDATPNWVCRGFCILIIILFLIAIFSSKGKGGRGGGTGGSGVASGILWAILSSAASSGGSSSSGGWSSGGGSSGGWGGFGGGGDFGGGGAGGDW
jgi:uncharacterized protein